MADSSGVNRRAPSFNGFISAAANKIEIGNKAC
jgi:hypothetical protein